MESDKRYDLSSIINDAVMTVLKEPVFQEGLIDQIKGGFPEGKFVSAHETIAKKMIGLVGPAMVNAGLIEAISGKSAIQHIIRNQETLAAELADIKKLVSAKAVTGEGKGVVDVKVDSKEIAAEIERISAKKFKEREAKNRANAEAMKIESAKAKLTAFRAKEEKKKTSLSTKFVSIETAVAAKVGKASYAEAAHVFPKKQEDREKKAAHSPEVLEWQKVERKINWRKRVLDAREKSLKKDSFKRYSPEEKRVYQEAIRASGRTYYTPEQRRAYKAGKSAV